MNHVGKASVRKNQQHGNSRRLVWGVARRARGGWFGASDVILLLAALHLACAGLMSRLACNPDLHPHEPSRETSPVDAVQRYPFC